MNKLSAYLFIALFSLNLGISASAFSAASTSNVDATTSSDKPLPTACSTQCLSKYGEVLGTGLGKVPAYSNCNAGCVVFSPNFFPDKKSGTYTGIKWQCVEYARRWLLINKGVVYGDVDIAADIWGLDFVTRVKDKTKFKLLSFVNGDTNQPKVGDLLIYAKAYLKTGHVAVISKIDSKAQLIDVMEQNFKNTKWQGDHARSIPYIIRNKSFWILDPYLLGWKRVSDQAL